MAFVKISEQASLYDNLEKKSVHELLTDINQEDHKVADAVKLAIPQIERLVTGIVERMKKGGRIFYMGAGTSGRLGVLDVTRPCAMPSRMPRMTPNRVGKICRSMTCRHSTRLSVLPLRGRRPM